MKKISKIEFFKFRYVFKSFFFIECQNIYYKIFKLLKGYGDPSQKCARFKKSLKINLKFFTDIISNNIFLHESYSTVLKQMPYY